MKKLFLLLSLSTAALAAAPSASSAKLVLDLPPILAGKAAPLCNSCNPCDPSCTNPCTTCTTCCGTTCMDSNASCTNCCNGSTCQTTVCPSACTSNANCSGSTPNCCNGTCQQAECNATGLLNDTGITWSGTDATGNNAGTTCSDAAQDCSYGWDKLEGSNTADGHAGFKFSKLDSSGNVTAGTSFECVRDERTGLIWEVKTSSSIMKSWSSAKTDAAAFTACNVSAGNWRLPTVKELLSIVSYYDVSPGPAIDTAYFSTNASSYWTGTELSSDTNKAWVVSFVDGTTKQLSKTDLYRFRLVYKAAQ